MKDNILPEEKLLRLIKGQKNPEVQIYPQGAPVSVGAKASLGFLQAIVSRGRKYLTPEYLNKFILVSFVLSGIYLLVSLAYLLLGLNKAVLPKIEAVKSEQVKSSVGQTAKKPLEYYLEGAKARPIFTGESASGQAPGVVNAELVKDINLMGIISGDNPQVIIEDKKNQKTYYVNKGQYFGDFLVEDIQSGKVILNYKGQKFELYL